MSGAYPASSWSGRVRQHRHRAGYDFRVVPEELDAETLRWIILAVLAGLVVGMYVIIRFVQKAATRVLMLVLLGVVGVALYVQRDSLADCVDTCSCTLFGQDVEIPENRNTGNCQ